MKLSINSLMGEKSDSLINERREEIGKVFFGTIIGYSIILLAIFLLIFIIPYIIFTLL